VYSVDLLHQTRDARASVAAAVDGWRQLHSSLDVTLTHVEAPV
jgi:hypothetical protein